MDALRDFFDAHRRSVAAVKIILDRPYGSRLSPGDLSLLDQMAREHDPAWTLSNLWARLSAEPIDGKAAPATVEWISLVRFVSGQVPLLTSFRAQVHGRLAEWLERNIARDVMFSEKQREWLALFADVIAEGLEIQSTDLDGPQFRTIGGAIEARALFGSEIDALLVELSAELTV